MANRPPAWLVLVAFRAAGGSVFNTIDGKTFSDVSLDEVPGMCNNVS